MKNIIITLIIIISSLSLLSFGKHPTNLNSSGITANASTCQWAVKCTGINGWSNSSFFTTIDSTSCNLNTTATINNSSCDGTYDGSASINTSNGTPPYSYLWNNNDTTSSINSVINGTYVVTSTDSIGCSSVDSILVGADNFISLSQSITAFIDTSNPGFPNTVQSHNIWVYDTLGLLNYGCNINIRPEFIISHQNSAIQQGQIELKWKSPFGFLTIPYSINNNGDAYGFWSSASSDSTGINAMTGSTNEITLRVKFKNQAPYGKYTAIWNTKEVDSLGNIIQTITANDTATLTLVDCNSLQSYSSQSNITCWNDSNGILSIDSIINGSGNYTYNWTDDLNPTITLSTNNSISNLSSGNYSCNITDDNWGCLINKGFSVSEPNELISSYSQDNVSCYSINDGGAIVNFFGGITGSSQGDTNYILGWAGTSEPVYLPYPQTVFNTSLLPSPYNAIPAGIYPYTVTDLNDCIIYDTITITEPDSLYANYILSNYNGYNVACFGDNNATIEIQINGGTAPFDNYLNNILKTGIISNNLSAGNYIDSIIDANGCAFSNLIPLHEPSELITTLNTTNISCNNLCDGEINSNTS
ncbi:MAG: SprB repeat-containing protein, partial [Flavobacteriales bacterium]